VSDTMKLIIPFVLTHLCMFSVTTSLVTLIFVE